MHLKQGAGEEF